MCGCFNDKDKAPVPESLAALGTRAEATGKQPSRSEVDNTASGGKASCARIVGRLRLRLGGGQ